MTEAEDGAALKARAQQFIAAIPHSLREAAWVSGLSRWRTLWKIELPLAWPGILGGIALTFAHTLGEFGVVLMVGGNLPGRTRTASIALFDQVQSFDMAGANRTALLLLALAFTVLTGTALLRGKERSWR